MSLDFIRAALIKQGYLVPLPGTPCPLFMLPSFSLHAVNYFNSLKKSIKGLKLNFTLINVSIIASINLSLLSL